MTMFPFTTQNKQDFINLRDIYTDAVYNPLLTHQDFLQEAWRLEFSKKTDTTSELLFKGVVYNEMKGAYSDQESGLYHKILSELHDNCYKYDSGGVPSSIPNLTYEQLVETHARHYHPSNTKVISYGNFDCRDNIRYLSEYFEKFERKSEVPIVSSSRFNAIKYKKGTFQPEMGLGGDDYKYINSYLCNEVNENAYETFKMSILSHLLVEGPNSTMYKALIESGLAPSFAAFTGYDNTLKDAMFNIGVQNIDKTQFSQIDKVITDNLKKVAEKGFERKFIDEILHQIEYSGKKPKSDFAINLLGSSFSFINHSDEPFKLLMMHELCARLREELQSDKEVFQQLVTKYFIDNKSVVKLEMHPDTELVGKLNTEEFTLLAKIKDGMTEQQRSENVEKSLEFERKQKKEFDINILPKIELKDIADAVETVTSTENKLLKTVPFVFFEQPTNKISFIRVKIDAKNLPVDLKEYVDLYSSFIPELGTKATSHEEFQNKLLSVSGGLDVGVEVYYKEDGLETITFKFSFLEENTKKAFDLIQELLTIPNFEDISHLNNLIKQKSVEIANNISQNGLSYAMSCALSGLSELHNVHSQFKNDLFACKLGSSLMTSTDNKEIISKTAEKLESLHYLLLKKERMSFAFHGSANQKEGIQSQSELLLTALKNENPIFEKELNNFERRPFIEKHYKKVIKTSARVSDCVEVLRAPRHSDKLYAISVVFNSLITWTKLHSSIREQGGAYGAGAKGSENGFLTLYSFRDPNPERTFIEFEKAILEIKSGKFEDVQLEDAKLFSFGKLDAVVAPQNKGLTKFLKGVEDAELNEVRKGIKNVTREDVMRYVEVVLVPQLEEGKTSRVIFGASDLPYNHFESKGWLTSEDFNFISENYFETEEDEEMKLIEKK